MENNNPWFIRGSSKARLVSVTPEAEATMAYIARVTSKDQSNQKFSGLLKYCLKHGHFSVFEQAYMTVEVVVPLAIAVQLLRHRSNTFQQFSGRYENQEMMRQHTEGLPTYSEMFYVPEEAREQDLTNRQNSIFSGDPLKTDKMWDIMTTSYKVALQCYEELLELGIAKEIARFVLPQGVYTRLYMTGSCRSFIHYLKVREDEGVAQHEHCELAEAVRGVFAQEFPVTYQTVCSLAEEDKRLSYLKEGVRNLEVENETLKSKESNLLYLIFKKLKNTIFRK